MGAAISLTCFITIFSQQASKIGGLATLYLKQCLDRGCRGPAKFGITHKASQHDLEELYLGPSIDLELLYASFLNQFFICMMFNSGIPFLTVNFFIFLAFSYFFDKVTFLRLYRLPPSFDATAAMATTNVLQYAVLLHLLIATWMYSNPDIFELESFFDLTEIPGAFTEEVGRAPPL